MGRENHDRLPEQAPGQEDLLGELDSIKTLLDPAHPGRFDSEPFREAPPPEDGIPVLNNVILEPGEPPVLTAAVEAGGEPPPGEEELEALADAIVERKIAALRDKIKRSVLAELKARLDGREG